MAVLKFFSRFHSFVGADILWQSSWDLKILILLRMVRLLGYGGTTFILGLYLNALGIRDSDVGLFMTLTLVGDLLVSFGLTYVGDGIGVRLTAVLGALLMCVSGIAFAVLDNFWLLLLASIAGVINPRYILPLFPNCPSKMAYSRVATTSANEIDPFKAIEEAAIARLSTPETRNDVFAWWTMMGMLGTAASNLITGWIVGVLQDGGVEVVDSHRIIFLGYAGIGLIKLFCCLLLSSDIELKASNKKGHCLPAPERQRDTNAAEERGALLPGSTSEPTYGAAGDAEAHTRATKSFAVSVRGRNRMFSPQSFAFMWRLSLAMAFDYIGSGLAGISWMTYFFKREYNMHEGALGSATFAAGIVSSVLNLASSPLSRTIGQVQTMVVCHTLNSLALLMVGLPGNKYIALIIFIFRIVTREMDSAPKQAFISAGVLDDERTSAMGVVNIAKTLGSCIGLYLTGLFAGIDQFWLAFIVAGALKMVYNALILAFFWRSNPR